MNDPKLYCGDCLEVMKNIPDNSINMVFCDLPYGTTRNSWDEIISFENLWEQYNRIVKDNGAIVLTSQQPFIMTMPIASKTLSLVCTTFFATLTNAKRLWLLKALQTTMP